MCSDRVWRDGEHLTIKTNDSMQNKTNSADSYLTAGLRRYAIIKNKGIFMDTLAITLDTKLHEWKPDIANQARERISEIIDLSDQEVLDIMRSRKVEQEVLDILDES